MRAIFIINSIFLINYIGFAQKPKENEYFSKINTSIEISKKVKSDEYFITGKDTVYCKFMIFDTTCQGYLNELSYTDLNGKKIELKGRKNVPDVLTFYKQGKIIDKTPLNPNKPDSYIRYTERAVDGKLIVYLTQQNRVVNPLASVKTFGIANNGWAKLDGPSGSYRFYIKMPDGIVYKINNSKNMKTIIKPYLLSCEEFKNKYTGDFSTEELLFMDMVKMYNSLCQ